MVTSVPSEHTFLDAFRSALAKPDEIARVILWLLSEQASYFAGTIPKVAGGR